MRQATQHFLARLDLIWLNLGYQPGHSQYTILQSQGLTLVHEVDDEGWQVVRPTYECIVAEAQELLSEAREVLAGTLHAEGTCTHHLISKSVATVDVTNWGGITSDSEKTLTVCWEVLQCPEENKVKVQGTRSGYDQGFGLKDKSKRFYENRD
ncbi:hypothetical protein BDR07DRAFT_1491636 [Suillus spraguei]|nr:hypothetical protein BDR07DRAFT_1491636 [Suillus spraguei]